MTDNAPTATLTAEADTATVTIKLAGDWSDNSRSPAWMPLAEKMKAMAPRHLVLTDDGLGPWKAGLIAFCLNLLRQAEAAGISADYQRLPHGVPQLLQLAMAVPQRAPERTVLPETGFLNTLGANVKLLWRKTVAATDFVGLISVTLLRFFAGQTRTKKRDIARQIARCGHQAIPIVSLMGFLIGVILAFIGSIPLKMFGADIYIATLIGIGIFRLMAATTVGTVMAGRTGAAFAAELGSMQANEEIDAYIAMGLSPVEILVLPRFIALSVTMPLLCIYADFLGILGGLAVGVLYTDVGFNTFLQHMQNTTSLSHVIIGIITSFVFGVLIALCGCYHGLHSGRNSTAVGQAATAAVVSSIVCMVFATAIITLTTVVIGL